MAHVLERLSAPNEKPPRDFDPGEITFLKAESNFLSYYLDDIGSSIGLGERKYLVMRDSTLLLGMQADNSRALLWGRHNGLQDAVTQLS